jgi:lipopolysaccharide transport system permease protein
MVAQRYRGSLLGGLWLLVTPLALVAAYTFVFHAVFQARWGGAEEHAAEFGIMLFAGMLIFWLFAECAGKASTLILEQANYVKKVVFPLEILPWPVLLTALWQLLMGSLVLLAVQAAVKGFLPLTALLFPLVILPFLPLLLGMLWGLAAIGVYVRDLPHLVNLALTLLMLLTPIFYPVERVPESIKFWVYLNPLTFMVEQARAVLVLGQMPDWQGLGIYTLAALVVCGVGHALFARLRRDFADVL